MPRPPTSSLARRPHPSAPTLPSSSATSSAAPTLRRAPPSGQAYSTAATTAAAGAGSPTLDFLYPGFGFFSRALPSAANGGTGPLSLCELVAWSLANGSFAGPPPPPPQPAPSPAPSSPSPPSAKTTLSSQPPPPPQPHRQPFDVRSWRSSEGMPALGGRRTMLAGGVGAGMAMGRCSCGRVRQGCLRCRGASTSAAGVKRREVVVEQEEEEGRIAGGRDEKGKGREVEDGRIRRVGDEAGETTVEADSVPSDPSAPPTPSARLTHLLSTHAPRNFPSVRGSSVSSSPRRNRRPSRSRALAPAADDVEASLAALWEAARDEAFVQALSEREQLDFVRGFTQLARALPSLPAAQTKPDPIDPAPSPAIAAKAERRLSLRNLASSHALSLLSSTRLWPSSAEPSVLPPSSSAHASAALHYLDALALSSSGPHLLAEALLPPPFLESVPHPTAEAARAAVDRLFHSSSLSRDSSSTAEQREKRAANLLKHQKTALALLLEAFEDPSSSISFPPTDGAEALLHLVSSSPSALSLLDPSSATTVQELGYTHVLRRRYGVLLSTLYPSPSRWVGDQDYARREPLGLHLVRFLAPAGNALEAQEVWRVVEAERVRRMEDEQGRGEVPNADALAEEERKRLAALTVLVEGLTMERYFGDANALARELEGLALTVQEEGVASPLSSSNEKDVELVASAFRVLAKLASDQGRMPILDRLLERLSALSSTSSSSASSPSSPSSLTLESAARRLRSSSHRYDISSVQSIFDTASSASEFITASPAEKARLWSQLVLAYARVNDVEKAVETVQTMAGKEGLQVPLSAVNAILYGFARRGDLKTTFELFSQVVEGVFPLVQPDLGSWNALVLACEMARDPTAAEGVVQEMKAVGFEPNLKTWTTLMNAYVENGQWSAAFAIFRFLNSQPRHSSLRPDTAAANVMLKACVLTAVPAEQVLQLFRGLVEHGLRPNMQTYTHVMQSVCHAGLMDVAEDLFLMLDAADRPRSRSPASATSPPASSSAFSSLPLPTPMGVVRPDQFIFANVIGGFLYSGQPAKARAFLAEMRSRGMAPTTTTMVIVLGARLRAHHHRLQDYSVYGVRSVLQQTRAFLEDDSLPVRKKQQPVKVDRSLAHGKEAVALLAPVIRALGKAKDKDGAVEVFEEALHLTKSARDGGVEGPVAVELYTSFMDALRRDENPADAARNVRVVWERVYDLVSQRYVRLRPDPSASSASTQRKKRLVDPAQASILAVPLTILIETLNRAGSDLEIESTWRRLADQGFVFDASNWNVLARYFARDLQLERAMWIVNNILTVPSAGVFSPSSSSSSSPSPPSSASPASSDLDDFLRDFSSSPRTEAIGRVPLRVRSFRHAELDRQRKQPLDIAAIFSTSPSPPSPAPSADSPSSGEAITATFAESYAARAATVWHPFGATLETLDGALETLTASGSARSVQLYKKAMKKQRVWQRKRQQQQAGEDGSEQVVEEMLTGQVGQDDLFVEPSEEFRAQLLRKYPRAALAIEQWKTRYERWAREREHFLAWVKRTGGAGVGGAGDGGFA